MYVFLKVLQYSYHFNFHLIRIKTADKKSWLAPWEQELRYSFDFPQGLGIRDLYILGTEVAL